MGQAKQRGTLEQRVKQAQEQKDDFYGTERSVAEVLAELGLPKESTVKVMLSIYLKKMNL
ncbi:hypothetical protein DKE39_017895 [Acinetobacter baumannii]|nr:hypothetical protein DKE39_017895 [Acinetobacter baumannii]VCW40636.1 hypothetical protein BANRA_00132 [Acinetobacter baumannii]